MGNLKVVGGLTDEVSRILVVEEYGRLCKKGSGGMLQGKCVKGVRDIVMEMRKCVMYGEIMDGFWSHPFSPLGTAEQSTCISSNHIFHNNSFDSIQHTSYFCFVFSCLSVLTVVVYYCDMHVVAFNWLNISKD